MILLSLSLIALGVAGLAARAAYRLAIAPLYVWRIMSSLAAWLILFLVLVEAMQ